MARRVLVVEDDRILRGLIMDVLRSSGTIHVSGAQDIAEAEHALSDVSHPFSAILLDASLPDGDGLALCRRLRVGGLRIPIAILTGHVGVHAEQLSLDHGATAHVEKPVRIGDLVDLVTALMADRV